MGSRSQEMFPRIFTSYDLWCYVQWFRRRCIYKIMLYLGRTRHCPVPSTSCDLCTCKIWSCYFHWFRRRCIVTRIYIILPWSWGQGHTKHCPVLYIMWPIRLQSLKLLCAMAEKEMHLQENTFYDPWPSGQSHMKQCPVPSTSCDLCTYKVWATSNGLGEDTITRNVTDRWTDDWPTLVRN